MMRKLITSALAMAGLLAIVRMANADGIPVTACCPESGCKVCKPIVETKTVIKPVYSEVCEDYCLPRCWSCGLLGGCSSDCGPGHSCGNVKTRKLMVVKLCKHEECVNKCVVDYAPAACSAPAPCCTTSTVIVQPAHSAPVATPVTIPATTPQRMPVLPPAK